MKMNNSASTIRKIPRHLRGLYEQVRAGLAEHRCSGRYKALHEQFDRLCQSLDAENSIDGLAIQAVLREIAAELTKTIARTSGGKPGRPAGSSRTREAIELDVGLLEQAKAEIRTGIPPKTAIRKVVKKYWPKERNQRTIEAHVRRLTRRLGKDIVQGDRLKEKAAKDIERLQALVAEGRTHEEAIATFNRERDSIAREQIAKARRAKTAEMKPWPPEKTS